MATLEDKILGEKNEYYCSSSEEEGNESGDSDKEEESVCTKEEPSRTVELDQWDGTSSNTGPKGVIRDWQRFKQLEAEKRKEQERERVELMKKLTLTCRSNLDDDKDKLQENDPELAELLEDDFLLEYQRQRMKEMLAQATKLRFGELINLANGDDFLKAIDDEDKAVTVVVHIYEKKVPGCEAMNGCLITLAEEYSYVKFCKILGSAAGLSKHFKKSGVPALLIYKNGQVIGNFVRVTENLGTDFYASDVEGFLLEHGIINDKNNVPKIIANSNDKDDSD
ncbi:phosducin-like protein [Diachasmimorpha longicaudata]|uniref:phosducin-like protein n=1 Tax=Diachasmimorpha longicaudata TaxID=58733 RepID=UPI0030B87ECC